MHDESVWESIKAIFGVSERRMKYYTWHKHSLGVRLKFVYLPIDDDNNFIYSSTFPFDLYTEGRPRL